MPMHPNPFFEFYAKTDRGMERSQNEDTVVLSPEIGLALVADGMGGYNAGEVASGLAAAILKQDIETDFAEASYAWESIPPADIQTWLTSRINRANEAILNSAKAHPQFADMGTTLVMALFQPTWACIAHAGDSRAYRWRNGELTQLTRDHSWIQEQIDAGLISPEEALLSNHGHLVTRALGIDLTLTPEVSMIDKASNDIFLLCSDGLTDMLDDASINQIICTHQHSLHSLSDALIAAANQAGGWDNVSAAVIKALPPPGKLKRFVFESFLQRWLNPKN
jgi:PPM family protein phosphatase